MQTFAQKQTPTETHKPNGPGRSNHAGNTAEPLSADHQDSAVAPPIVHEVLGSSGQPLDAATRTFMEPRFGHDFSHVRVHADAKAAESAQTVNALAYTAGSHIVFGTGQFEPKKKEGRKLFAHELAHVVQQSENDPNPGTLRLGPIRDPYELQAAQLADSLTGSAGAASAKTLNRVPTRGVLQRVPGMIGVDPLGPILAVNELVAEQAYVNAVNQLKTIDPTIYGYLSKTKLNGPRAAVLTALAADPTARIQFTFNLEVKTAALPPNTDAEFEGKDTQLTGTGANRTLTSNMVMNISRGASASLAENLYHEGLHMLIFMDHLRDGFLPTSPHGAALTNYKKIAQAQPGYGYLSAELEVFIDLDLSNRKLNTPGAAKKDSDKLLADLWEEKYVRDQEKTKFAAPFTNSSLAAAYIVKDLGELGIRANPSDRNLISIIQKAATILDAIDRQLGTTPSPTQTAPNQATPKNKQSTPANP